MKRFLQLHLLIPYPPSNVNRDDLGRPKTAVMGGANRLRISSQSLKRAWRTSDVFREALAGHIGTRTKNMGVEVFNALKEKGVADKKAHEWAGKIAEVFGKRKSGKGGGGDAEAQTEHPELEIEQLAHFSPEELEAIDALVDKLAESGKGPEKEDLDLLRDKHRAADIALFGRMIAAVPKFNVEAAAQVAHAITVHKVAVENDYFTAVDDLNSGEVDRGAAHIGETEFGAGLFYLYICVDRHQLVANLDGDEDLAKKALAALVEAAATVSPSGKQNSFGSRARAIYGMVETGDQQPRSLSMAYLKPVYGESVFEGAVRELEELRERMDAAYDGCADGYEIMNVPAGRGSLKDLIGFAQV